MTDKEMQNVLEISPIEKAEGTILGEYKGKAVCMPKDTLLNRHIAIFGATGTMKSRAVIRNALFQSIKRGESIIVTDSKAEMYADTSEMFREAGYEVKVFNLKDPEHGDSWNCMDDLNGDTLMAQVLTNVIIGNTSSGKGDHFWDTQTESDGTEAQQTEAQGIPTLHIILFAGGMVVAVGALVAMKVVSKRRAADDDYDDEW